MVVTALLTDLDGTLWDSAQWLATLLEPEDALRRGRFADALRTPKNGVTAAKLLGSHYSAAGFERACRDHSVAGLLYADAGEVLQALGAKGTTLGVVTGLPAWIARPMLEATGLLPLFSTIQTARRGVRPKPNPAGLLAALSDLDCPAEAAVYVGDAAVDGEAARAASVRFLGAGWGYGAGLPKGAEVASSWTSVWDHL